MNKRATNQKKDFAYYFLLVSLVIGFAVEFLGASCVVYYMVKEVRWWR